MHPENYTSLAWMQRRCVLKMHTIELGFVSYLAATDRWTIPQAKFYVDRKWSCRAATRSPAGRASRQHPSAPTAATSTFLDGCCTLLTAATALRPPPPAVRFWPRLHYGGLRQLGLRCRLPYEMSPRGTSVARSLNWRGSRGRVVANWAENADRGCAWKPIWGSRAAFVWRPSRSARSPLDWRSTALQQGAHGSVRARGAHPIFFLILCVFKIAL